MEFCKVVHNVICNQVKNIQEMKICHRRRTDIQLIASIDVFHFAELFGKLLTGKV